MRDLVGHAAFVLAMTVGGAALGGVPGAAVGAGVAVGIVLLALRLSALDPAVTVGTAVGTVLASLVAFLVTTALWGLGGHSLAGSTSVAEVLRPGLVIGLLYLGAVVGARRFSGLGLGLGRTAPPGRGVAKLLDSSVAIDGRIAGIVEAGFLDGPLYVPKFVLAELQQVADASDASKRNRGRRGLDILKELQARSDLEVVISELDYPLIADVDHKLIEAAAELGAKILTNDFNLHKVAELRGVGVLNVNQLANAVKPVVHVGETMTVVIRKEGKEAEQGVAYLDDGTMVVVEGARSDIGQTIDVDVTSVHQTAAGKMIFGRRDGGRPQLASGPESSRRPGRRPAGEAEGSGRGRTR